MTVARGATSEAAMPELRIERVPAREWPELAARMRREEGAAFVDLFAGPQVDDDDQLTILLSLPERRSWIALRDTLPRGGTYPTLTAVFPASAAYEREAYARAGVIAEGNPWLTPVSFGSLQPAPDGVVDYPLGPVRSGVVESGHYTLRTVGEEIVDVRLQLDYKHRGVETLMTQARLDHVPLFAERTSGTDAVAHSLASVQAIERLAGIDVGRSVSLLRVLLAELERLHVHVEFQAELCRATGLAVGQAQLEIVREELLRLNARSTGHRYLFGSNVIGGVGPSLAALDRADVQRTLEAQRMTLGQLGSLLLASSSHMDRLQTTGRVTPQLARELDLTGPVARASGLDVDARRDHPYAGYTDLAVPVPLRDDGDAAARMGIRLDEAGIAADLALRASEEVREISVRSPIGRPALRPRSVALGWAEGARGTEIHWVETDDAGTVARYRIRSASFCCWQAFPRAIPGGNILTDFPIIEQSFGLSYAGNDR